MAPEALVKPHLYDPKCECDPCASFTRYRRENPHLYGMDDARLVTAWMRWAPIRNALTCLAVIVACIVGIAWAWTSRADAKTPQPIAIPAAHAKARARCPLDKPLVCRAALIHAYEAIAWQHKENLALAREMVGNVAAWTCIHNGKGARSGTGEGPWNDTGDPYWGGLQMDRTFMREYGRDMIRLHHGGLADTWTPREQLIVAQRAYAQGRGYNPWPTTGRSCGLL